MLLALRHPAAAQRAMPDPALRPNFNPLCDSSLVPCLAIDEAAGHVYGHVQVLPETALRDTAAVFPFGATLGLFGRFVGGVSTSYAFWKEGDALYQQLGPVRLSLTARLLPLFPLFSRRESPVGSDGESQYTPPRRLQLGLGYEQELRVGPFSGANSLGRLADLAALRLIGSKLLGPVQLSASLGALYEGPGLLATGEAAAQLGLYLPFFPVLKVYVEGMGRGFPAYEKKAETLPAAAATIGTAISAPAPLHPQGVVGLGLSFHPHARVDLGVSVQRGFGGLAPWAVSVSFLTLSVGKTYQGHAATPVAQLAGEVATVAAVALSEFIAKLPIDPKLDENCQILDKDNVTVLGHFGKRTANHYYCEQDGFRVPIGHELNRDRKGTKLCRDDAMQDCLLQRQGKQWLAVHRPRLDGACRMTDSDGVVLGILGQPTADGKHCRYPAEKDNGAYGTYAAFQEQPIGTLFHTDADRTAVCVDAAMQRCFLRPPPGQHSLAWSGDQRNATALLGGLGHGFVEQAEDIKQKVQGAARLTKDVATGKVKVTTLYEEAKEAVVGVVADTTELLTDPEKQTEAAQAAQRKVDQLEQQLEDWANKPPEEQSEDLFGTAGRLGAQAISGAVIGGGTRALGEAAGLANAARKGAAAEAGVAKAGRKGKKLAEAAEHHPGPKALPPRPEPKGLLSGPPDPVKPPEAGRFIVDPKGNVLIEPKGGFTEGNARGTVVKTHYPNK